MSTLFISEFAQVATDGNGHPIAAGVEPNLAEQAVTYSTTAQSAALNAATRFVVIHSATAFHFLVGTNPTATTSKKRVAAGVDYFFAIDPALVGGSLKIAAIDA